MNFRFVGALGTPAAKIAVISEGTALQVAAGSKHSLALVRTREDEATGQATIFAWGFVEVCVARAPQVPNLLP